VLIAVDHCRTATFSRSRCFDDEHTLNLAGRRDAEHPLENEPHLDMHAIGHREGRDGRVLRVALPERHRQSGNVEAQRVRDASNSPPSHAKSSHHISCTTASNSSKNSIVPEMHHP
jgi:hypothetical protein